jgi:hypothetical protein
MEQPIKKIITSNYIIDLLRNISSKCLAIKPDDQFVRLTLNNRLITEMQSNIYRRDPSMSSTPPAELFVMKRASVFGWAGLKASLNFFRWTRKTSMLELCKQASIAAESNSLLVTLCALRSILEITGNCCLLRRDLERFTDPIDNILEKMNWLNGVDGIIDSRIAGMRSNYSKILTNGLRSSKKISYKPGELEVNLEAKDLLNGVDLLAESVRGARAAYDFFSEFAHPNLASSLINYDQTSVRFNIDEIIFYSVQYEQNKFGDAFLENFGSVLIEGIEIISECIDEMVKIDEYLNRKADEVAIVAKRVIRDTIKKDPFAFDAHELCPCYSSKNIQYCCGKLINKSKFGNWPMVRANNAGVLH